MKVEELYTLKPVTLGVSSITLVDGRPFVDALNTIGSINIKPGTRMSIRYLKDFIAATCTPEEQVVINAWEIDENSSAEAYPLDPSTLSFGDADKGTASRAIAFIATFIMGIITVSFTGAICWISYTEHRLPPLMEVIVLVFSWMIIVWQAQGVISKERQGVFSVLVGDQKDQNTAKSMIGDFMKWRFGGDKQ